MRWIEKLYRRIFPVTAQQADQERARRLRADNQALQDALERWNHAENMADFWQRVNTFDRGHRE